MKRIFRPGQGIQVPDGTRVFPFLNPTDSTSGLPVGLFEGVSVAKGEIEARQSSKIQVHPLVTVIVWVAAGRLQLKMKDSVQPAPFVLELAAEDGAVALPGSFFQLINPSDAPCRVLYIVSPPYVFERMADGRPGYDDAVVLDAGWDALAAGAYRLPETADAERMRAERARAIARIAGRNGRAPE
jgi:hypothetical protein